MEDEINVIETIRALERRGAYAQAAAYAVALPQEMRARPSVALEHARARMRQGYMNRAKDVLAEADRGSAPKGERLILDMEEASLLIYCDVAIRAALDAARAAFTKATEDGAIERADLAEAERVQTRILLTAAIYYEIDKGTGQRARERLPELARILEQAGRMDEALAARLTYAERLDDAQSRIDALKALAAQALTAGRPGIAAESHLITAHQLLAQGAPTATVNTEIDEAEALYQKTSHAHGLIDVRRARAHLAVERERAGRDELESCLDEYRRIDLPRNALSLLMDLSQLAHERGDIRAAADYRRQSLALADQVGMGLVRDNFQLAQADLLMRNNDYGTAIELCSAALAADPPAFSAASYEQLMATANAFVENYDEAYKLGRRALAGFEKLGAEESASNAATKLASDLTAARLDKAWDEAEALLLDWIPRDEQRGDAAAAVSKRELVAQIYLNRFSFSPTHRNEPLMLDLAEQALAAAEELAQRLPPREAARRTGNLHQLRGQLYQARGDMQGVERAWRDALAAYEPAGLAMESANCRYMIGVLRLNLANQDLMAHFAEAETNLRGALAYYEQAGMRGQAADTCYMFALLYSNAAPRVTPDLGAQMLDAALGHLAVGEANYDAVRREYAVGSVLEALRGKRVLTQKSRRIYELALEILALSRPDPAEAWRWAQKAKARSLVDTLGSGSVLPSRIVAELEEHAESFAMMSRERELAARLDRATPEDRLVLRAELAALRASMARDTYLSDYLELRTGASLERDDLDALLEPEIEAGRPCVCLDWISVGDHLFLLALRPGGPPQLIPLTLTLSTVRDFVTENLAGQSFRSTLRDTPELLRELDALVAPLAQLSARDELLILSPTGPLHALPLHALWLEGEPLLLRNPIVYCPSLSVLRHSLSRRREISQERTAALFGDPSGDRAESSTLVEDLALSFKTTALTGAAVTSAAFADAVAERDIVHFQGHAVHDRAEPLDSRLLLADGALTARDVFGLHKLQAELVTLAACESAANVVATGDEPLGLIPAFLYAGANAVLATLWRVHRASAAETMRHFYDALSGSAQTANKAQSLREAMLAVRAVPGFEAPYHWAPFVLHGDWH
ncbi:MAG TPA: CHAT domain-containing protein [Pyrinomonadaceae bacterium]|jgi:CHAT domain-containing protein